MNTTTPTAAHTLSAAELDDIEAIAHAAPKCWYGTYQIADGIADEKAVALIEACTPDMVLDLIAQARAALTGQATAPAQAAPSEQDERVLFDKADIRDVFGAQPSYRERELMFAAFKVGRAAQGASSAPTEPVTFMGVDPLNIGKGATLPMAPDSWRLGFYKSGTELRFGYQDNGPLVAWDAVKDLIAAPAAPCCGQCFGKGVMQTIGEVCEVCAGTGKSRVTAAPFGPDGKEAIAILRRAMTLTGIHDVARGMLTLHFSNEWNKSIATPSGASGAQGEPTGATGCGGMGRWGDMPCLGCDACPAFQATGAAGGEAVPYKVALEAVERIRGCAATYIEDHSKDGYPGQLGVRPQDVAKMWALEIHDINAKEFLDETIADRAQIRLLAQGALDTLAASPSPSSPQGQDKRPQWSKEPPTEQADYWNWNGDPDHAPMIYHVLWSGTAKKCFVSIGQYDITNAIFCDTFGGWWLKIEQPAIPSGHDSANGGERSGK